MFGRLPLAILGAAFVATLYFSSPNELSSSSGTTGVPVTGGSTGASTGATTGSGATISGNVIYVEDLPEHVSANTFGYFSGSWQSLTGRHTAGIQFKSIAFNPGSVASNIKTYSHTESVLVEQGTEINYPSGSYGAGSAPGGVSVYGGTVNSGNSFLVQTSDTGTIPSGRHLAYWVRTDVGITYWDSTPSYSNTSWARQEFVLVKLPCYDASIDTRKTYGQANKAGELPADANAPLRHMNFGVWDYKGGLFLGNMPASGKDASGTSRTQLYVQSGSGYVSTYTFASLSMLDLGKPSDSATSGAIDTGIYFPGSSDSNLTTGETAVNWDTKWNITAGDPATGTPVDYSLHPFIHKTLTNGNSNDFVSFPLCKLGDTTPSMALSNICVAMVGEQNIIDYGTKCWHYFASREYETGSTFPRSDCAPRVWLIDPYTP